MGTKYYIENWWATNPDEVQALTGLLQLQWNYPWEGTVEDFHSGLTKTAYPTTIKERRIACALSHYQIWKQSAKLNESYIVMEHDCAWQANFDPEIVINSKYNIVGLNSPLRATRKAKEFHDKVQASKGDIVDVPTIDDMKVPQGLAGNSCYYINPQGAKDLLNAVKTYGLWPNDAIMCKQLIPNMGVTKTYYSHVQGIRSTTT
jgi:GR25 family glycosyltransferase involved in LPS biosynthesis